MEVNGCTQPLNSTRANSSQMFSTPVIMLTASASAWPDSRTSVIFSWRRGIERSVTAPARGAIRITGARSAAAITPSQIVEWVISQASQPMPSRCIHSVTR